MDAIEREKVPVCHTRFEYKAQRHQLFGECVRRLMAEFNLKKLFKKLGIDKAIVQAGRFLLTRVRLI